MKGLDIPFSTEVREIDEVYPAGLDPFKVPEFLSEQKAAAFIMDQKENEIVITSDTIVILNDRILEKPKSRDEAILMLELLSDATHTVVTGVCIQAKDYRLVFSDQTVVEFMPLTNEEITYYVDNYRPFDKAGAYGVQEWIGYIGIKKLTGSYFTVMGFPVHRVYSELKKFL